MLSEAQFAAIGRFTLAFNRVEVVIDATTMPARQVYWKDLRLLGRGFSLAALGAERDAAASAPPHGRRPSGTNTRKLPQ